MCIGQRRQRLGVRRRIDRDLLERQDLALREGRGVLRDEGVDRGLFDDLRALRTKLAAERGVPPYVVFGDAALRDMARRRPSSRSSPCPGANR